MRSLKTSELRDLCVTVAPRTSTEICQALSAVLNCHRAAHTPTPRVLVHAVNVIVFFFVFSSPLLFTVSFKYIAFWPAILVSLCFYGVLEVSDRLEKPFGWIKPNHDLSIFGHNLWNECEALHDVVDDSGEQVQDYQAIMRVKQSVSPNLTRSKTTVADLCKRPTEKKNSCRCGDMRVCHGDILDASRGKGIGKGSILLHYIDFRNARHHIRELHTATSFSGVCRLLCHDPKRIILWEAFRYKLLLCIVRWNRTPTCWSCNRLCLIAYCTCRLS